MLRILGDDTVDGLPGVTRGGVLTLAALAVLSLSPVLFVMRNDATGQDNDSPDSESIRKLIGDDPGESIYNDRLKRFKFRLENMHVRTAVAFMDMYKHGDSGDENSSNRPNLIGAWGDPLTNSIVVIGPPEAEQAIRQTLAEWEAEIVGVPGIDDTLEVQLVYRERERRELLRELTLLEAELTACLALPDTPERRQDPRFQEQYKQNDEAITLLNGRVESFEQELRVVERKIEVIEKNIRRRDRLQPVESASNEPAATSIQRLSPQAVTQTDRGSDASQQPADESGNR